MNPNSVIEKIVRSVSGERVLQEIVPILERNSPFTSTAFAEEALYLTERLLALGFRDSQMIQFPADGKTLVGDWVLPTGWDVEKGELRVAEPSITTSFARVPKSVVMYSAPASGVFEVRSEPVRGCLYFTPIRGIDLWGVEKLCRSHGCAGFIVFNEDLPENFTRWHNDSFLPRNESGLFAFSLTGKDGRRLAEHLRTHGFARAAVELVTRSEPRSLHLVTGTIGEGAGEVWALAHLAEPGAWDNCSGVAACVEALRIVDQLVKSGELPPLRARIRVLFSWEIYGFLAYCLDRGRETDASPGGFRSLRDSVKAGINVDGLGLPAAANTCVNVIANPDAAPDISDSILAWIARETNKMTGERLRIEPAAFGLADNFIADPCFGIPCPMFEHNESPRRLWHTDADVPDALDAQSLHFATAALASYLYLVANSQDWLTAEQIDQEFLPSLLPGDQPEWYKAEVQALRRWSALRYLGETVPLITEPTPDGLRRLAPGPLTLRKLPYSIRDSIEWSPAYSTYLNEPLFWLNGARTFEEVARRVRVRFPGFQEGKLYEYFRFLQEHGYISGLAPTS